MRKTNKKRVAYNREALFGYGYRDRKLEDKCEEDNKLKQESFIHSPLMLLSFSTTASLGRSIPFGIFPG